MQRNIPNNEYQKILENMPICCVDVVIYYNHKVLLVYRKNEPCKDKWWVPGGRVYKNETLKQAAARKAKEELGLDIEVEKLIDTYEYMSSKGPFDLETGVHTINVTFLAKLSDENQKIRIDETSSDYKWVSKNDGLDPYIIKVLNDSKVFS